jgi:hypothetical protein
MFEGNDDVYCRVFGKFDGIRTETVQSLLESTLIKKAKVWNAFFELYI